MSPKFKNFLPADTYKTFVEQNPLSIIITDKAGNIEYVNSKFIELTGYTYNEILGKNPKILKSGNKTQAEYKILWDTILSGGVWKGEFLNKKERWKFIYRICSYFSYQKSQGRNNKFYCSEGRYY